MCTSDITYAIADFECCGVTNLFVCIRIVFEFLKCFEYSYYCLWICVLLVASKIIAAFVNMYFKNMVLLAFEINMIAKILSLASSSASVFTFFLMYFHKCLNTDCDTSSIWPLYTKSDLCISAIFAKSTMNSLL